MNFVLAVLNLLASIMLLRLVLHQGRRPVCLRRRRRMHNGLYSGGERRPSRRVSYDMRITRRYGDILGGRTSVCAPVSLGCFSDSNIIVSQNRTTYLRPHVPLVGLSHPSASATNVLPARSIIYAELVTGEDLIPTARLDKD